MRGSWCRCARVPLDWYFCMYLSAHVYVCGPVWCLCLCSCSGVGQRYCECACGVTHDVMTCVCRPTSCAWFLLLPVELEPISPSAWAGTARARHVVGVGWHSSRPLPALRAQMATTAPRARRPQLVEQPSYAEKVGRRLQNLRSASLQDGLGAVRGEQHRCSPDEQLPTARALASSSGSAGQGGSDAGSSAVH